MLNEQMLNQVSGGIPVIDLIGKFFSAMFPTTWGSVGGSIAKYEAHDELGQTAEVAHARGVYQPPYFQHVGIQKGDQHLTVLNSDNVRDLAGAKLYVGERHQLPGVVTSVIDKLSNTKAGVGAGSTGLFGVIIPDSAKGTEVSIPVPGTAPIKMTVTKTDTKSSPISKITGAGVNLGLTLSAGISLTEVKVTQVDRMAQQSYYEWKAQMDMNQRIFEEQQRQQQQQQQSNIWSHTY